MPRLFDMVAPAALLELVLWHRATASRRSRHSCRVSWQRHFLEDRRTALRWSHSSTSVPSTCGQHVQHDILGLEELTLFVAVPWKLISKVLSLHLLKSWDESHHHLIRKVREGPLHLEGHRHFGVKAPLVDQSMIWDQCLDHCQLPSLMDVEAPSAWVVGLITLQILRRFAHLFLTKNA